MYYPRVLESEKVTDLRYSFTGTRNFYPFTMGNTNSHPKHLGALTSPKGLGNVVTIVIFAILSIAAVGLRIWSKVVIRRAFRADDYCIFVALVCVISASVSTGCIRKL